MDNITTVKLENVNHVVFNVQLVLDQLLANAILATYHTQYLDMNVLINLQHLENAQCLMNGLEYHKTGLHVIVMHSHLASVVKINVANKKWLKLLYQQQNYVKKKVILLFHPIGVLILLLLNQLVDLIIQEILS